MRALLSIVGIVVSCWTTIASASPIEDDAFTAFEVLCLLASDPVTELPNTVQWIGFVAMSRDQIEKSFEPGTVDRAWVGKTTSPSLTSWINSLGMSALVWVNFMRANNQFRSNDRSLSPLVSGKSSKTTPNAPRQRRTRWTEWIVQRALLGFR
jgi:hypothetical protein